MLAHIHPAIRWSKKDSRLSIVYTMDVCEQTVYFTDHFAMLGRPKCPLNRVQTSGVKRAAKTEALLDKYGMIKAWEMLPAAVERRDGKSVVWFVRGTGNGKLVAVPEILYRLIMTKYRVCQWGVPPRYAESSFVMSMQQYRCDSPWDNNLVALVAQEPVGWPPPKIEVIKSGKKSPQIVLKALGD